VNRVKKIHHINEDEILSHTILLKILVMSYV